MDTTRYRTKTLKEAARILREADEGDWLEFMAMLTEDPDICHYCSLKIIGNIQNLLGAQVHALGVILHPKNDQPPDNGRVN